jgi:3-dehydroquinate dehydratase
MQDNDGTKLLYRQLISGTESVDWLDHSSQEWDRLIENTKTLVHTSTKLKDY